MGLKSISSLHFRTPYTLMRVPEYLRWFDSTTLGGMYRLLSSKVYRVTLGSLKFVNESGYVTQLAKRYEEGSLCAYATDEELMEAFNFSRRSVEDHRKKLISLKLIKAEKFKEGYIYTLGFVVKATDQSGYSVGEELEAHYIFQWESWAAFPDGSEEKAAFRYYLAKNLASDKKGDFILEELGKIFPNIPQNFAKILGLDSGVLPAPRDNKKQVKKSPIEVKVNEDIKEVGSHRNLTKNEVSNSFEAVELFRGLFGKASTSLERISKSYSANILEDENLREPLREVIREQLPEKERGTNTLFFTYQLSQTTREDPTSATILWEALRMDILGILPNSSGSKTFGVARKHIEDVLKVYSWDQLIWTFRVALRREKDGLYLANNIFGLQSVIGNLAGEYVSYQSAIKKERAIQSQQAAVNAMSDEERLKSIQARMEEVSQNSQATKPHTPEKTYEDLLKDAESETNEAKKKILLLAAKVLKSKGEK